MDLARRRTALAVAAVASLVLWPVQISSLFGLPAHPLLLHVPVVFVPILGFAAIAVATSQRFEPHRFTVAAFSVVTLIFTLLTVGAGQAFKEEQEREIEDKAMLSNHGGAGETVRFAMVLLTFALIGVLFARRPHIVLRVVIVLLALTAIGFVIRAGHLGATLAWDS
jgi:uncharacterized membrane protein